MTLRRTVGQGTVRADDVPKGFRKRTSSYEYRTTGRGGKGIVAMSITEKNGRIVASFPIDDSDQIMLVTDGGQLIRCPVDGIVALRRGPRGGNLR